MGAGDATPDDTVPGAVDFAESAVDVSHTLSKVETGVLSGLDLLQLQQRCVGPLRALATLESKEAGTNVKPFGGKSKKKTLIPHCKYSQSDYSLHCAHDSNPHVAQTRRREEAVLLHGLGHGISVWRRRKGRERRGKFFL